MPVQFSPKKICIEEKCKAIEIATKAKNQANLTLWCNGFKLDQGTRAAVVWKLNNKWLTQKIALGKIKKIFGAKIGVISEGVKIAEQKYLKI